MNNQIDKLIDLFSSFPTIGKKTATRIVVDLISRNKNKMPIIANGINDAFHAIKICEICHNVDIVNPCSICSSVKRNKDILCIVENIEDLWVIEKNNIFNGVYHVLGGVLSAVKGVGPDDLNMESLARRLDEISEIIIAVSSSLDGQTTALFLADMFADKVDKISKLGYGIPFGSEIGYLDEGTLNAAFQSRKIV